MALKSDLKWTAKRKIRQATGAGVNKMRKGVSIGKDKLASTLWKTGVKHPGLTKTTATVGGILSKAGKFVKAHPVMIGASVLGGIAVDQFKKNRKRKRILGKSQIR